MNQMSLFIDPPGLAESYDGHSVHSWPRGQTTSIHPAQPGVAPVSKPHRRRSCPALSTFPAPVVLSLGNEWLNPAAFLGRPEALHTCQALTERELKGI